MKGIGPTEILVILGIVVLLFGGKKLPELARGSGKALRIFKTEVKALDDDDDADAADDGKPEIKAATPDINRVDSHRADSHRADNHRADPAEKPEQA